MIETDLTSPIRGLADELKRQVAASRDLMADTRRVSLAPIEESDDGGVLMNVDLGEKVESFGVNGHAHDQLGAYLGIHTKLYDRLLVKHPDLLAGLANGLLFREPTKNMLRILDGNVRAVLSNKYRPRDNWDLVEQAVLPALEEHPGYVVFKRCDLTETRMYLKIVLPEFELPITPRVGDVMRGGVIIQNSEVGAGSLGVYPYSDILDCTNGMVHTEFGQRRIHVGKRIEGEADAAWEFYSDQTLALDDQAFFAKCRDTIKAVLNETVFEVIASQMRELAGIVVESDPIPAVKEIAKRHGLTEAEGTSMLTALTTGGDLTAWGYANALTRTARDLPNPDRQTELETLAGRLTSDWSLAGV